MCFDTRFPAKCHAHKSSYSKSSSMVLLGVPSMTGPVQKYRRQVTRHPSLRPPDTPGTCWIRTRAEQSRAEQSRRLSLRAQLATHQRKSRTQRAPNTTLRLHLGMAFETLEFLGDCLSVSTLHAQLPFRATESGDGWKCDCDGDLCPASNDEEKHLPETRWGLFPLDTVRTLRNRSRLPSSQPPRHFLKIAGPQLHSSASL
jgi:hypothetical protein